MVDFGTRVIKSAKTGEVTEEIIRVDPDQRTQIEKDTQLKAGQIADLEAQITPRMVREAIIGSARTFPTGHPRQGKSAAQAIADIDAEIEAIRANA